MSEPERCPICGGLLIDHPEMLPCPGGAMSELRCPCGDRTLACCSGECVDPERYDAWKRRLRKAQEYLAVVLLEASLDPDPPPEGP